MITDDDNSNAQTRGTLQTAPLRPPSEMINPVVARPDDPYEALAARRRSIARRREAFDAHNAQVGLAKPPSDAAMAVTARGARAVAARHFQDRLERARERNAEALADVAEARRWLRDHGPREHQEDDEIREEEEEEEEGGAAAEHRDLARRRLAREKAAFRTMAEEEGSLLSASFLRQVQLGVSFSGEPGAAANAAAEPRQDEDEDEEGLWLERRRHRAWENERIVRRLFEQQRKRSLLAI